MANTPTDNNPFYEYLVDDPEQMMASTPLSPHFSPNVFGGAFDVRDRPHHATRSGNQAMSSPGHDRPNSINESAATIAVSVPGVPGLVVNAQQISSLQQRLQQQQQLHRPALGGLGELELTAAGTGTGAGAGAGAGSAAAENQGHHQHHQFAALHSQFADHQGPLALLHAQQQGHRQAPATWFPPGYGAPSYRDSSSSSQYYQQQAAATVSSSSPSSSTAVSVVANPPINITAAGGLSNSNTGAGGGQLFDFGFAAPHPAEQSFLGGDYADITPLSTAAAAGTAAALTAHPQPTATFDFHSSPWRPRLQDSSSVTLTPSIAAVAAAELNQDIHKHSKGSMEDDSDVKETSWADGDDDDEYRRRAGVSSSTSPRPRRQQRKGKRRAVADAGAADGAEDEDEPTSPAGRTSVSGRSNKSVSVASTTGSSSKTASAPRLRSASRTSKNASQKPAETAEERRTRASHNLVEKQYRNRLNAQFEGLLNALPEQVRGPASTGDGGGGGGGGGGGDESDPQPADQERRVSKAEVLDMARRHIKSLERERDELQRERGDLLRNLEMMEREMAANGAGRLHEFLDVEGPPGERGGPSWRNA
ncbi:Allergen Fus c 3 [Colletotrichum fructicola]|uniref:Allergen Fus c 3 n=1 Tax=Colletotrichum fructicola (strain Nara gc5) TaxID=1213859 RepID=A0A7J6J615_COLFN|nr:Allergen Fus c 3 [Colletotrichum fructicola]KAF4483938.1 Allergen Fus c 3 [Colletotrichum fructicola Nara gc5]KAF4894492.1 Allergen Fus c 3 [Colletotrichum fructicola]KAF4894711.1 Allergen Fus c 3 [Colletotrichum fructicola]KAF4924110.1 Allergen Fus c 3 [Colletotrichum fructicola]